jgi:hypothetical protein
MEYEISMGMGHVTNSSSCIHFIPPEVMAHPDIQSFLTKYNIQGFVGTPWYRSECTSILLTEEQKKAFADEYNRNRDGYGSPLDLASNKDHAIVVYGDEFQTIARVFSRLCDKVAEALGASIQTTDYN